MKQEILIEEMKKFDRRMYRLIATFTMLILLAGNAVMAQAPQGINYQAVVRDASGNQNAVKEQQQMINEQNDKIAELTRMLLDMKESEPDK